MDEIMNILKKILLGSFLSSMMTVANASMMLGTDLVVAEDGDVIVTYLSYSAAYSNTLYLFTDDGIDNNDIEIFNNKMTPFGYSMNLGSFSAGTELLFYIDVNDTQNRYFSGSDASLNPDGIVHTQVDKEYSANLVYVGFEDIFNGGDFDYNDLEISLTNVGDIKTTRAVPEPSSMLLLIFALLLLTATVKKRIKQ